MICFWQHIFPTSCLQRNCTETHFILMCFSLLTLLKWNLLSTSGGWSYARLLQIEKIAYYLFLAFRHLKSTLILKLFKCQFRHYYWKLSIDRYFIYCILHLAKFLNFSFAGNLRDQERSLVSFSTCLILTEEHRKEVKCQGLYHHKY